MNPIVTTSDSIDNANRRNIDYWRRKRAGLEALSQTRSRPTLPTIPNAKPDSTAAPVDKLGIAVLDSTRGRASANVANPERIQPYPELQFTAEPALLKAYFMVARLSSDSTEVALMRFRLSVAASDRSGKFAALARTYLDSLGVE